MTEWNKACLPCRLVHATCNGERPCKRCSALGRPDHCVNVERKKRGRPRKNPIEGEELLEKRARIDGEHPTRTDGDGGAHGGNATTFHPSFPGIPLQQQAYHSLFPQSSSPSDSPHSSPPSSSSSASSSSPLNVEHHIESAGFAAARRHRHQHNNNHNDSRHHSHHSQHRYHSSGSSRHAHSDRRSRENDGEEEPTNVRMLIDEMRELRKENRVLNEKLAFFCEKVDRRLSSSEHKIDSLSTTLTTATTSAAPFISPWSSSPPSFSASPLYIRKEILKDLPFLLDYDIISEQVPFLIDDLRKAFIVRRIFDPTPEEDLTVPVTTYANPACCALLGTLLHELVGAPCWFALEQPIRAYLTAKSDKPVGDIFLNAVTRKGNRKRLLRLFSRNQVFYNAKGNAKWWISIIDKTEELPPTAQPDSNKIALMLNRNRRGGATLSLVPKDGEAEDDDGAENTPAVSTSPSSSASSPSSSSAMPAATITTISSLSNTPPALSSSARTIATPSSFAATANFFNPACATFSSPFISTSSLAPAPSPSSSFSSLLYTSGLSGLIGAPIGELSDFAGSIAGGGSRANTGGERNEPLDQELQELWALLAPSEREPTPM